MYLFKHVHQKPFLQGPKHERMSQGAPVGPCISVLGKPTNSPTNTGRS